MPLFHESEHHLVRTYCGNLFDISFSPEEAAFAPFFLTDQQCPAYTTSGLMWESPCPFPASVNLPLSKNVPPSFVETARQVCLVRKRRRKRWCQLPRCLPMFISVRFDTFSDIVVVLRSRETHRKETFHIYWLWEWM